MSHCSPSERGPQDTLFSFDEFNSFSFYMSKRIKINKPTVTAFYTNKQRKYEWRRKYPKACRFKQILDFVFTWNLILFQIILCLFFIYQKKKSSSSSLMMINTNFLSEVLNFFLLYIKNMNNHKDKHSAWGSCVALRSHDREKGKNVFWFANEN